MTEKMTPEKYDYYLNVPQDYNQLPVGFKSLGPGLDRYSEHHDIFFGNKLVHCYHHDELVAGRAGAYAHTIYFTPIHHWNKIMEENKPKTIEEVVQPKTIEEVVQIYNDAVEKFANKRCFDSGRSGDPFNVKKDDINIIFKGGPGYSNASSLCKDKCDKHGFVIYIKYIRDGGEFHIPSSFIELYVPKIKVKNWKTGKEYDAEFYNKYVKFGCAKILNTDITDALTHIESFRHLAEYKSPTGMIIGDGIFTTETLRSLKEAIQNNKK